MEVMQKFHHLFGKQTNEALKLTTETDRTLTYQHTTQAYKMMFVSSNFRHSKDVNFEVTPHILNMHRTDTEENVCSSQQWNNHNHQHHQHCWYNPYEISLSNYT
jgi:hypothetical protein